MGRAVAGVRIGNQGCRINFHRHETRSKIPEINQRHAKSTCLWCRRFGSSRGCSVSSFSCPNSAPSTSSSSMSSSSDSFSIKEAQALLQSAQTQPTLAFASWVSSSGSIGGLRHACLYFERKKKKKVRVTPPPGKLLNKYQAPIFLHYLTKARLC